MQRDSGDPEPADEFDRIIAGWRQEKSVPAWPEESSEPDESAVARGRDVPAEPDAPDAARGRDEPAEPDAPRAAPSLPVDRRLPAGPDEGHFVPPEPPPLPHVGPPALVGLALLTLGVVLVTAPWWVGVPDAYGLPLGLLSLSAGLAWLVLRLWPDPPSYGEGDGEDNGAVL